MYDSLCFYKLFGLTWLFHKYLINFLLYFVNLITIQFIELSLGSLQNNAATNALCHCQNAFLALVIE